MNFGEAIRRS